MNVPNALVFLAGGEGIVIGRHLLEAVVQFQQLRGRRDALKACIIVAQGILFGAKK